MEIENWILRRLTSLIATGLTKGIERPLANNMTLSIPSQSHLNFEWIEGIRRRKNNKLCLRTKKSNTETAQQVYGIASYLYEIHVKRKEKRFPLPVVPWLTNLM